jgi:hypothetical protein
MLLLQVVLLLPNVFCARNVLHPIITTELRENQTHRHSSFSFFASGFFAQESFPSSICSLCARGFSQGFQGPVSCCFVLRKKGK